MLNYAGLFLIVQCSKVLSGMISRVGNSLNLEITSNRRVEKYTSSKDIKSFLALVLIILFVPRQITKKITHVSLFAIQLMQCYHDLYVVENLITLHLLEF